MTTRHLPEVNTPDQTPDDIHEDVVARPNSRVYEVAIGIAVIAFGIIVYFAADAIEVGRDGQSFGPRWWPTALSIAAIVIGLILVVQARPYAAIIANVVTRTTLPDLVIGDSSDVIRFSTA